MKTKSTNFDSARYIVAGFLLVFCALWTMAQDIDTDVPTGWAIVPGNGVESTTGGGDGDVVTATSVNELRNYAASPDSLIILVEGTISGSDKLTIASNKTIIGKGVDAKISGLELSMNGVSNIIIRNLKISGARDGIAARNTHHLWIDHCEVWDCSDGLIDITNESNYATVSWCRFHYVNQSDHRLACLIGSGGGDHPEDWDKLKVTYHHCWYGNNVDSRMPRLMYGLGHIYNDYYNCSGNGYCIGVGSYGSALVENNYFKDVNDPHTFMYDLYCWITARGNIYDNTSGNQDNGKGGSRDLSSAEFSFPVRAFNTPPYLYTMDSTVDIPDLVSNGAGPNQQYGETGLMPVPGNGAVRLNLKPELKWTKGQSATSYIVSFGTANPPAEVVTVSTQTYSPDSLNQGTVYYWSVDQVTESDTIEGKVWRFRTKGPVSGWPYVAISSPSNDSVFEAPASITFETEAWDSVGTISNVEFFNGYRPIGIDTTAPYSTIWDDIDAGTYEIKAVLTNNEGKSFTSETLEITVVNVIPYVTITSPASLSEFSAPASITITADAADDDGTVASVEFFNSSVSLGVDSVSPYSITWDGVPAGKYYIKAEVTDNDGKSSVSRLIIVNVVNETAVVNTDAGNLTLYPNPVSDKLILDLKDNYSDDVYLSLYNTLGKIVMNEKLSGSVHILDLKNLPDGVYIMTLTSDQIEITRKIIKN